MASGEGYDLAAVTGIDKAMLGTAQKQNWEETITLQAHASEMGKDVTASTEKDDDGDMEDSQVTSGQGKGRTIMQDVGAMY
jgi:hypothetical protein